MLFRSGVERMRQRPIGDLIRGLKAWGAEISSVNPINEDCPPVLLRANGLRGGRAEVRGDVSSQFLSGMLMAAPYCSSDVFLSVQGPLVSKPYVEMTIRVMEAFGVEVESPREGEYRIAAPQCYRGINYSIEPDASAASYFFALAAITGGKIRVFDLNFQALQGDVQFAKVLERMGCEVASGDD